MKMSSRPTAAALAVAALTLAVEGGAPLAAIQQAPAPAPAPPAAPAPAPVPATQPTPPAQGGGRWQSTEPAAKEAKPAEPVKTCEDTLADDQALEQVLRALTFKSGAQDRPLGPPRILGLKAIKEDELWQLLGGRPAKPDVHQMAVLLKRLVGLELFVRVTPVVRLAGDGTPSLEVTLEEQPAVRKVVLEGLQEVKPESLLEVMLQTPTAGDDSPPFRGSDFFDDDDEDDHADAGKKGEQTPAEPLPRCPEPSPRTSWLARADGEVVHPGVVWRGLRPALQRVMSELYGRGYEMASLAAELAADGTLTLRVDEGRVASVEIRGVSPRIADEVRERLDLPVGRTFVSGELHGLLRGLEGTFPFIRADDRERFTRAEPTVVEEEAPAGTRRYRTTEPSPIAATDDTPGVPPRVARMAASLGVPQSLVDAASSAQSSRWYTVEGRTLIIHLRSDRGKVALHWAEIIRHTPVTGFAPGLELLGRIWDKENRAHLTFDLAANVNTHRATSAGPPPPDPMMPPPVTPAGQQRWRFDWLTGARVQIPAARIAEIGVQGYSRVDSPDRWRIDRVDSYLYSMIFNRPDSEYFRRDGLTTFITAHLLERLTAGLEYRRDRYRSLESYANAFTVFDRASPSRPTPAIDEGVLGSILVRLEWSSQRASPQRIGGTMRDPERSLVNHRHYEWCRLATVNTLEVADPSLGGDARFRFVRLVSDSSACARLSHEHGFKVRFRAAGRASSDRLPAQRREALGGWTALRGYDFKETRDGDFSLLGTVEYRISGLSVFLDAGSVSALEGGFGPLKTGLGASLNLGDEAHLAVAWRTDDRARLRPELRFYFNRTF